VIITIGREFGSGGSEIGRKLSERLGIPYYDKNMIEQVAEKLGFSPEYVRKVEETPTGSFLFSMAMYTYGGYNAGATDEGVVPAELQVTAAQTEYILEKAAEGDCIFVGRCADYLLKGRHDVLRVFICADAKARLEHVMERYKLTEKEALRAISQTDRKRAAYYNANTQCRWGARESYDLILNSTALGIDGAVDLLEACYRAKAK